jgi:hypothetical protein
LANFGEAFERFLTPEKEPSPTARGSEPLKRYKCDEQATAEGSQSATAESGVADVKSQKPNNDEVCSVSADGEAGFRETLDLSAKKTLARRY